MKYTSVGGKRHVLMLPVNALVKGLNHVATHDPLLEGWMGVSPPELARWVQGRAGKSSPRTLRLTYFVLVWLPIVLSLL